MKLAKARSVVAPVVPHMDRLFDRLFGMPMGLDPPPYEAAWTPPMDFSETDDAYLVRLEAPGVHKTDLDLMVENNLLTITGKRERFEEEETEEHIWREREVGRFTRALRLPQPVDADAIDATFTDGILRVHLPKAEKAQRNHVPVK